MHKTFILNLYLATGFVARVTGFTRDLYTLNQRLLEQRVPHIHRVAKGGYSVCRTQSIKQSLTDGPAE